MSSIAGRSQLNGAFGKAARALPTAVGDAVGYELKNITVSGDSWNFLLFKGRVVHTSDAADLLRCSGTTTAHEQGPPLMICHVVSCTSRWFLLRLVARGSAPRFSERP